MILSSLFLQTIADTDTDTDTDTATPDSDSTPPGETDTTDIHDDSDTRSTTDSETDTRVPYMQPTIKVKVTNKTASYRARVCAYNEVTCDTPADCEPPLPTGPFNAGRVAGDVICDAAEFDIPYDEEYVYLDISTDTIVLI